jgi:hypothetical protein
VLGVSENRFGATGSNPMPSQPSTTRTTLMPPNDDDSKHWRNRAADMRVLSNSMKDPEVVARMLKLANDYDKVAEQAAQRAK